MEAVGGMVAMYPSAGRRAGVPYGQDPSQGGRPGAKQVVAGQSQGIPGAPPPYLMQPSGYPPSHSAATAAAAVAAASGGRIPGPPSQPYAPPYSTGVGAGPPQPYRPAAAPAPPSSTARPSMLPAAPYAAAGEAQARFGRRASTSAQAPDPPLPARTSWPLQTGHAGSAVVPTAPQYVPSAATGSRPAVAGAPAARPQPLPPTTQQLPPTVSRVTPPGPFPAGAAGLLMPGGARPRPLATDQAARWQSREGTGNGPLPTSAARPPSQPPPRSQQPPPPLPGPPIPHNLAAAASSNRSAALAALAARKAPRVPSGGSSRAAGTMPSRVDERLAVAQSRGMPPPAFTVEEDMGPVGDAGPLVPCPTCGRSFNQLAHAKHVKVCEKVFVKKRKAFNTAAVRVAGTEASKFFDAKRGQPKMDAVKAADRAGSARRGASAASGVGGARARSVASKVPKWKAQSEQLRLAMRNNRTLAAAAAAGRDVRTVELESVPDQLDDRVPCPHCGRKFAALTAERHIPKCKDTVAKPTFQRAKAGTGAYARR